MRLPVSVYKRHGYPRLRLSDGSSVALCARRGGRLYPAHKVARVIELGIETDRIAGGVPFDSYLGAVAGVCDLATPASKAFVWTPETIRVNECRRDAAKHAVSRARDFLRLKVDANVDWLRLDRGVDGDARAYRVRLTPEELCKG